MPEHAHLVVHPRAAEYDISTILKAIKWSSARWYDGHRDGPLQIDDNLL
jgi:hypothetical protein